MRKRSWIEPCPSCSTNDLVLDAGRNSIHRLGSWIQAFMNIADNNYGTNPYYGGSRAATCRRCGFHRPAEPEIEPEPTI